jgi:hypothetical protein
MLVIWKAVLWQKSIYSRVARYKPVDSSEVAKAALGFSWPPSQISAEYCNIPDLHAAGEMGALGHC